MKARVALACGALAALAFSSAGRASADPIGYAALPVAKAPAAGARPAPREIGKDEKVPGFHLGAYTRGFNEAVVLFGSTVEADAYSANRTGSNPSGACFSRADQETDFNPTLAVLSRQTGHMVRVNKKAAKIVPIDPAKQPRPPVVLYRSEKMTKTATGANLEFVDAWVDPLTRGVRLASRSSMSFARVATGPGGLEVYAARGDGAEPSLQVLIVAPSAPEIARDVPSALSTARSLETHPFSADASRATSACGHIRTALTVGETGGDMTSITSTLILGKPPARVVDADDGDSPAEDTRFRTRVLVTHVSASKLLNQREPTLSVTHGFVGRETIGDF